MNAPPAQYAKTHDGYDIAYYVAGSGHTLIRTPIMWNHIGRQWDPDMPGPFDALAERFRLVLYDARGQGLSSRGLLETLSFSDYVQDLAAVVNQVGSETFLLMGWSFASSVAIQYACEHPEQVDALILLDYRDYSNRDYSKTRAAMLQLAEENWSLFVEAATRTGFPDTDPDRVKEIALDSSTQSDWIKRAKTLQAVPSFELLKNVTVPTLLVSTRAGTRPYSGEEEASDAAAAVAGARLVLIEGRGAFKTAPDGSPPPHCPGH